MADNKLYDELYKSGYYTKTNEDFNNQFKTPEGQEKLYNALNSAGYYTKSKDEFQGQFFNSSVSDIATQPEEQKETLSKWDKLKVDYIQKTRGDEYAAKEQAELEAPKQIIPGWEEKTTGEKFSAGVKSGWEGTKGGVKYTGAVMLEGLDKMDGEEDWQFDNRLFESAKENFKAAPRGEGIWYQLGSFTPQMLGIAAAAVSAPVTAGTSMSAIPAIIGGSNIGLLVAASAGGSMHEYDKYNEQEGKEGSDIERIGVGIGAGAAEYLAERIGLDRYMPKGSMSKAFTKFLSTSGSDVAREIGESAIKKDPSLNGFLKKTAKNMLEEGTEESLTESGNILIENLYKDDKDEVGFKEAISRISDAFGGGALMGGVISPVTYGADVAYQNKINQSEQPSGDVAPDAAPQLTVDPRQAIEATYRQIGEEYANKNTGTIKQIEVTTQPGEPNKPHTVIFEDGLGGMRVRDEEGNETFVHENNISGEPFEMTVDEFVNQQLAAYDQSQQNEQLRNDSQMEYEGQLLTRIPDGQGQGDKSEIWETEDGMYVEVPNEDVAVWEQSKQANPQITPKIVKKVYGKTNVTGIKNEDGSISVSDPASLEQANSLKEAVEQETGGKATVQAELIPNEDATEPETYQLSIVPQTAVENNQNDISEPVQDGNVSEVPAAPTYPLDKNGQPDVDQMDEIQTFNYNAETFGLETAIADLQGDIQLITDKIAKSEKKLTTSDTKTKIKTRLEIKSLQEQKAKLEQLIPKVSQNGNNKTETVAEVPKTEVQTNQDQGVDNSENSESLQLNQLQNEESEKSLPEVEGQPIAIEGENTPQAQQGQGNEEGLEENVNDTSAHRIFSGGSPIQFKEGLRANSKESVYRMTGLPQIQDIQNNGIVRSKKGKIKGGRANEVHWSEGGDNLSYPATEGQYILEANNSDVNGLVGPLDAKNLKAIWTFRNGKFENVKDEVESKEQPATDIKTVAPIAETWMNKPNVISGKFPESKVQSIVYHGSRSQFDDFDENMIGKNDIGVFGRGIYLSENKSNASQYGGGDYANVKAYEADIKKPYIVNFNDERTVREAKKLLTGKDIPSEYDGVIVYESGKMNEVVVRNKSQLSRITTDEDIWKAYDSGKYQKAIDEGRLTEDQAKEIVESSGIKYKTIADQIDQAASEVNTNPTGAQKEAGNYKKGHVSIQGMDITIENPKGSFRKGVDEDGRAWETEMKSHYGYFKQTTGKDGDHIDTFMGDNPESQTVFVVDQNNPKSGEFDESKVMLGFDTPQQAKEAYLSNYEAGWKGFGSITPVSTEDFKIWLYDGAKQRKPFSEYKDTPEALTPEQVSFTYFDGGEHTGEIISENDGKVKIKAENGRVYTVPKEKLGKQLTPVIPESKPLLDVLSEGKNKNGEKKPKGITTVFEESNGNVLVYGTKTNQTRLSIEGLSADEIKEELDFENKRKIRAEKEIPEQEEYLRTKMITDVSMAVDEALKANRKTIEITKVTIPWLEKKLAEKQSTPLPEVKPDYKGFSKAVSSSSRFRPMQTVNFDNPIIGPSGAKLNSYEWKYTWGIDEDKRDGGVKDVRISDWTQAEQNAETGRGIVHQFTVELPNGEVKTVSSESVLNLLGYTDTTPMKSFPSLVNAVKTLAKQQMQLALLNAQKKQYDEAFEFFNNADKPEIILQPKEDWNIVQKSRNADGEVNSSTRFKMGNITYDQDNKYDMKTGKYTAIITASPETIKNAAGEWVKKQVELQGIRNPQFQLSDLKSRIARQERKVNDITKNSTPTSKPLSDLLNEAKEVVQEKKLTPEIGQYSSPESFDVKSLSEFQVALSKGEVSIDEFKKAFNTAISSKEAVLSELSGMTKAELLKGMSGMGQYRYKNEKKDQVVRAIWSDYLMDFAFGSISYTMDGTSTEVIVGRKVEKTTQDDLDKYAEESKKRKEEYLARVREYKKALTNPETLPEFKIFIDKNGLDKLSPEQKAAYDDLVTDKTIDNRNAVAENKAIIKKVDLAGVEMDITETKHTKTGVPLFVVKLSERVSKEDYQDLNSKAKQLGGYYSSFRGLGAVPGFQFKSQEQAQKFVDLKKEDASNLDVIEEKQDTKLQDRVSKLRENAQKIIDRVDGELSKDRLTNTAKRASEAASAEARLNKEKQIAQTMMNIADAIENGDVKLLDGVKAKTHIELLDSLVRQAKSKEMSAKYPSYSERMAHEGESVTSETLEYSKDTYYPNIYSDHIKSLIDKVGQRSGVKLIASRWSKRLSQSRNKDYYQISTQGEVDELTDMVNALMGNEKSYNRVAEEIADYNRLKSMGIENDSMLRAALREYVQYRGKSQEVDKVKKLERALVGRKNIGVDFFPTPKETAQLMVDEAGIEEGMSVLEPSAGNGNIADQIKEAGVRPDVIELSSALEEVLVAKGYDVVGSDFMAFNDKKYDRIIMNPPFSNGMDGDHVMHAYELLNEGGKIVAIVGEGTFIRNDKKATVFREWLESVGGTEEKLNQGTFQDKTLLNTTGANARMVIIEKGEKANFRILGEKGAANLDKAEEATTRLDNLKVAREMEDAEKDAKSIRLATGWEKGVDGKWRYEVPDNIEIKNIGASNLGGVLGQDHELFKSYPKLRYVKNGDIIIDPYRREEGSYTPKGLNGSPTIYANSKSEKGLKSVLAHEIQHAIQDVEGFVRGGNIEAIKDKYTTEYNELNGLANVIKNGLEVNKGNDQFVNHLNKLKSEFETDNGITPDEFIEKYPTIETFVGNNTPFQIYKRLAGEVESRNVQSRLNLTTEERRNTLLSETEDVAREDQIVLMEGLGVSNLEATTNHQEIIDLLESGANEKDQVVLGSNKELASEVAGKVSEENHNYILNAGKELSGFEVMGKVFINSGISTNNVVSTWIHEKTHRQLKRIFPSKTRRNQFLTAVFNHVGEKEINSVLAEIYHSDSKEQRAEEYLAFKVQEYGMSGDVTADNETKKVIFELLNKFTTLKNIQDAKNSINLAQQGTRGRNAHDLIPGRKGLQENGGNSSNRTPSFSRSLRQDESGKSGTGKELIDYIKAENKSVPLSDYLSRAKEVTLSKLASKQDKNTILIDGSPRSTLNSNGKPIAQTEEGIRNFYKWFKNSKVVDAEGRPLVVYHGTTSDFNSFDLKHTGKNTDSGAFGKGFYFSINPKYSSTYALRKNDNGSVMPIYLSIKNPLSVNSLSDIPKIKPPSETEEDLLNGPENYSRLFTEKLISQGNDGVIAYLDEYVAFSPSQIKSATGNNGDFNPEDNNINFSRGAATLSEHLSNAKENIEKNKTDRLAEKEAKLNHIIDITPKEKVTHYNHTLMRNKIRDFAQGYRTGGADAKRLLTLIKREVINYAKDKMTLGTTGGRDISKLLTMVNSATRPEHLDKILNSIDDMASENERRKTLEAIQKLLNTHRPKKTNNKLSGSLDPDVYMALDKIRLIVQIENPNDIDKYVDSIDPDDVEQIALFSTFSDLNRKSTEEIKDALDKLSELITTGKIWFNAELERRKKYHESLRNKVIDKITANRGTMTEQDYRSLDKVIKTGKMERYFDSNQSFEWMLDKISNDKTEDTAKGWMQDYFGDLVIRAANAESKGVREQTELIHQKAAEIFGVDKRKLAKRFSENSEQIKKTGVTYVDRNGDRLEIPLSQNEAYKKWMEYQDPTLAKTFEAMGWDDTTINQLDEFIDPKVKQWAEWQINEFYPNYYKGVNEKFREAYFANLPFNDKYTPIRREVTDVKDNDDMLLQTGSVLATVGNASLKSRETNIHNLRLVDGDMMLSVHILEMEHFKAWVNEMRELRSVFSSRQVQHAIKNEAGESARATINRHIGDFASGGADKSNVIAAVDKVRRAFVTAELGLNLTLFPKQNVSLLTYLGEVPIKNYVTGLVDLVLNLKTAFQTLQTSEMFTDRYENGWTHEVRSAMKTSKSNTFSGAKSTFADIRNILMFPTKAGDYVAVMGGWTVYKYHYDLQKEAGKTNEQAHEYALNKFERSTSRSQQSAKLADTSELQKGSWGKYFTMFKNSQQQYYRYESAAFRNLTKGRGSKMNNIKIIALYHIVLPVVFQLVSNLFTDDDDETENKRLLRAGILGSFNGLLIASDIIESLLEKAMGETWDYAATPIEGSVNNAGNGLAGLIKGIDEGDREKAFKGLDKLMWGVNNLTVGLPYRPSKKLIQQGKDLLQPERVANEKAEEQAKEILKSAAQYMKALNDAYEYRDTELTQKLEAPKWKDIAQAAKDIDFDFKIPINSMKARISELKNFNKQLDISPEAKKLNDDEILENQKSINELYIELNKKYKDVNFPNNYK